MSNTGTKAMISTGVPPNQTKQNREFGNKMTNLTSCNAIPTGQTSPRFFSIDEIIARH
jgi:hypothetical protein